MYVCMYVCMYVINHSRNVGGGGGGGGGAVVGSSSHRPYHGHWPGAPSTYVVANRHYLSWNGDPFCKIPKSK